MSWIGWMAFLQHRVGEPCPGFPLFLLQKKLGGKKRRKQKVLATIVKTNGAVAFDSRDNAPQLRLMEAWASAGRRLSPGQSNHRRSTGSPPSAVVTKARGCIPPSIFPLPRPIGHSRKSRAETGGANAVEPPAGPITAAAAFAQARALPCAGMASPNGPGKSRKGWFSRKAKVPPPLLPLVQDAKQVSKAGKGAHVKVGHVVVVLEALVPSWVLKKDREPIVDERSGPSVEVQYKVVHDGKAKAA